MLPAYSVKTHAPGAKLLVGELTKGWNVHKLCNLMWFCVFGLCKFQRFFFEFSPTLTTREHAYKLFKPRCTSGVRQNFYTERVINLWNSLPPTVSFTSSLFRRTICTVNFSRFMYH